MNPNNTTITDAELAELRRLHAAATPGEWFVQNGHRHREQCCATLHDGKGRVICDTLNAEDVMIFEEPDEGSVYYCEGYRIHDLESAAALHNAFVPILARLEAAERERDTATDDEAGHWIGIIRSLDPENLCDVFDGLGFKENLRQWLAARDAQQRREGAAAWLEADANSAESQMWTREKQVQAAKRLRDGGE